MQSTVQDQVVQLSRRNVVSPSLVSSSIQREGFPFQRRACSAAVVSLIGAMSVFHAGAVHAADDAQVEALKKEIAALKQQLNAAKGPASAASAPEVSAPAANPPVAPVAAPAAAEAPRALAEVVVTSRKPLAAVKEVPQSVSVVSGDELKREDSASLEAITKRLSNVKWNYGNSQTSSYSIRGIGKIANNQAADPSVGLYVDGVAYAYNSLGSFDFFDVDTVAVSRGPQGFLFGKNTTIGGIQVNTKRPSFVAATDLSVGFNIYENQSYARANGNLTASGSSTGPLVDGLLAYRTSLRVNKGGGWISNSYNTDNEYINADRVSGRVQLLYTPTATFDARLALEVTPRMNENANIGSTNFFFKKTPGTYANGATNSALTPERRLSRRWFTRNANYTVQGNYYNNEFIASDSQQAVVTGTNGAALELNWALNDDHKLSSITAYKNYYFNAFRDDEGTVFDVQSVAGNQIAYDQITQELRLASRLSDKVKLTSGLFALKSTNRVTSNGAFGTDGGAWFASDAQYNRLDVDSAGRQLLSDSVADLWRQTPLVAKNRTVALYSTADWEATEKIALTTGGRFSFDRRHLTQESRVAQQGYGADLYNNDLAAARYFGTTYAALTAPQRAQLEDARSIRRGRVAALYNAFSADSLDGHHFTWSVSPRYKINENATTYVSFAHGEKAGVPGVLATTGITGPGDTIGQPVSYSVRPEKNNAFELGFKSTLLNNTLIFNTAVFVNDIKDYQQTVSFEDQAATQLARLTDPNATTVYTNAPGNVPKVRAKGIEVDLAYSGFRNLELRLSGAYNDARYREYTRAALPVERANEGSFYDASGKTLPGASKWTFNVGAAYQRPVWDDKVVHASFNTSYASRFNSDNNLSEYAWIEAAAVTDVSFGLGGAGGKWDINTYVKNVFNDGTDRNITWNATAPGFPRQYGITFSTKL